jgi:hypothetical protein
MSTKTQPLTPAATTQTTRLLWPMVATRTARLRAAVRRIDPYELVIVGTLLAIVLIATVRANLPLLVSAPPAPIATPQQPIIAFRDRIVVATPTLGMPAPTDEPSAAVVELAAPAPAEPAPIEPTPVAQPEPADLQVMDAQPAQPAQPATAEPTIEAYWADDTHFVVNGPAIPTIAPDMIGHVDSQGWRCGDTYGDWRDRSPYYVHAECYAK